MKVFIISAFLFGVVLAQEPYNLPSVNVDELVNDSKEFRQVTECFLGEGPCSDVFALYRDAFLESLRTGCRRCSPEDKHFAYVYITELKKQAPETYKKAKDYVNMSEEEVEEFLKIVQQ